NAELIARHADKVVFPAAMVLKRFREIAQVSPEKIVIRPQGVLRKNPYKNCRVEAYRKICKKHNLKSDTQIVLSIAYIDKRKGPDLFVEMALHVLKLKPKTTFIWIGHSEPEMEAAVKSRIVELGLQEQVLFIGFVHEPMDYYAAASVYALTSREDPFPNVVLESAEVGVPVVAFQGASGASDFIVEHGGRLADYLNTKDFASQVCELLDLPFKEVSVGVDSLQQYTLDLLHHLNGFPRISVLVPNYNYERYISKRLDTIYGQTFPIYEVIILDDASIDQSVNIIDAYLERTGNEAIVIVNEKNSGSVFLQWQKGISLSRGDLLWIAEADDLADSGFLNELSSVFKNPDLVMAYSQSKQIDDNGKIVAENYLEYTKDVSDCWLIDYEREGLEEISEALVIKNTIPNVSAVLFRRRSIEDAFSDIGEELFNYRVAGDWLVYLHVLKKGDVYFCRKPLNLHRRHTKSTTNSTQKLKHVEEVSSVQAVARVLSAPSR
ncbi:MAG: glycosyltransferase, partial [Anaerolineales bacterium]